MLSRKVRASTPDVMRTARWMNAASWSLSAALLALCALPTALWSIALVHAVRVAGIVGRWPRYGEPDPRDMPIAIRTEPVENLVAVGVILACTWLGLFLHRRARSPLRRAGLAPAACVALIAFGAALLRLDPAGVFEWYVG